jgi:hypothetical protein
MAFNSERKGLIVTVYQIAYYEIDQSNKTEMRRACIYHTLGGEQ